MTNTQVYVWNNSLRNNVIIGPCHQCARVLEVTISTVFSVFTPYSFAPFHTQYEAFVVGISFILDS